jgi:radical SAM protein with 4Fe4S-binding SPASM domain
VTTNNPSNGARSERVPLAFMTAAVDLAAGAAPTAFPRLVSIETVSTCNAQCVFCPHPLLGKNAHPETMADATFERIVREVAAHEEVEVLSLSFQNEPLTDPHLFSRIATVRALAPRLKICIVTNGALLTGHRLEALLADPPDLIKISVNGITADEYEATMVGLKFDRVMANIDALIARTRGQAIPDLQINTVYTEAAAATGLRTLHEFWKAKGIRLHVMNLESRAGMLQSLQQHSAQEWHVRSWCKRPEEQLSVWPNGDVALCCADWTKEVVLGNVHDTSLQDIWHGRTMNYYRAVLRSGDVGGLHPCNVCTAAEAVVDGAVYTELGKLAEALG